VRRPPRAFRKPAPALAAAQVRAERVDRLRAERHDALLLPLAEDPHAPLAKVDVLEIQPRQLGHADAARVERLQDRPVAPAGLVVDETLAEERLALIDREVGGQPAGEARGPDLAGRIHAEAPAPDQEAEEAPERRQAPRDRRARQPAGVEIREIAAEHARIRVHQRAEPPAIEERDTVQEVRPVAAHGVLRGPTLRDQVPEERGHGGAALLTAGRLHALSDSRR
jgi:hypothetical protein